LCFNPPAGPVPRVVPAGRDLYAGDGAVPRAAEIGRELGEQHLAYARLWCAIAPAPSFGMALEGAAEGGSKHAVGAAGGGRGAVHASSRAAAHRAWNTIGFLRRLARFDMADAPVAGSLAAPTACRLW